MEKKYYVTTNKSHAGVLCYLGFKYFKFSDKDELEYTFEQTDEFNQALLDLKQLKLKYRK